MTVFISGGCKNGKSTIAEDLAKKLAEGSPLYYVATMVPSDDEDRHRIEMHVAERDGKGFETVECPDGIAPCLARDRSGTFLVDSVTAYLSNKMFTREGKVLGNAGEKAAEDMLLLADSVKNAVFVSDYIYSDAEKYDELTELYRKNLAHADKMLAKRCELVIEVSASGVTVHKGEMI